jgi:D-alanyl-D-alanine carboxypeptidase (penicillin-binding protein 5/6)
VVPCGLFEHDVLGTIRAWPVRVRPGTREKRSMRRGTGLVRINDIKIGTALLSLLLLLVVSGGATLDPAGAQERAPESGASGPPPQSTPGAQATGPPEIEAEAWALVDEESGLFLAGENADERLPMGSVTKIMTALVVLEEGVDLNDEVTISEEAESYVGTTYSNVGLIQGERVTVRDLLAATLIPSGTDAAYALAEYVGDGSVGNFVEMMNDQASAMGLEDTNFETPAGLDTNGNYSSARDLAAMTRVALQYPLFAELVDTADATISTQNREIEFSNTNQLLTTYPPATGVKTGTTPQAGANLAASAEANDESYISIVIGAEDSDERFRASEALLEYAFTNYDREPLVDEGEVYEELPLPYRPDETVELAAAEDVIGVVGADSDVERRVTTEDELPPSAAAGEELGDVEVLVNGQRVGESPLVAQEGYVEASLWDRISYTAGGLLERAQEAVTGLFVQL